jgi:hypothetical protein
MASVFGCLLAAVSGLAPAADPPRIYENRLVPVTQPRPILADHPEYVEPIREVHRFEAPVLVDDPGADLNVRAWRFSYNARGIIEMPNRLRADRTAIIVVHPWGIDDGRGWKTPEPAGVAFACTPERNQLCLQHMGQVVNPFLKSLRGKAAVVAYSLPGREDSIRKKMYRSVRGQPSAEERKQGERELADKLAAFPYQGEPVPGKLTLSSEHPVGDYFRQFPGLDAGPKFNHAGFWDLPIPVAKPIEVQPDDYVIYDPEGYDILKDLLKKQGVRHVLLTGYHADMCVCKTTAGYENLRRDFNVFLVGDAMLATFPANASPSKATTATVSFAALQQLVTQVSWIHYEGAAQGKR